MEIEEYYKLVKSALKFYNYNYDQDILQELVFFAYSKAKDFDESKGEFSTYIYKIIRNKYIQLKKQEEKNKCISLDKKINDDGLTLLELVCSGTSNKEEIIEIIKLIKNQIEPPLELWLKGYTQEEISQILGIKHQPLVSKLINMNIIKIKKYCQENNIKYGG